MDVKHALTVLNRLASRRPGEARRLEALRGRLEQLAETALEVAVETGDPAGAVLAKRVAEEAPVELAERLMLRSEEADYQGAVPLREVALAATAPSRVGSEHGRKRRAGKRAAATRLR
jgi:hypothetical protein